MLAPMETQTEQSTDITLSVSSLDGGDLVLFAPPEDLEKGRVTHDGGPVRVLLVDGWAGDYHLLVENLRDSRLPIELTWVDRAEKALHHLCKEANPARPHILLIDPILPGTDGWEVLEDLREQGCGEDLAIVVQASTRSEFILRRCRELGVEAMVEKPVVSEGFRLLLESLGFGLTTAAPVPS